MNLSAKIVEKAEWESIESFAHEELFGKEYLDLYKDYNFAVLVSGGADMVCYATIKELDADTAFLNFGGTFKKYQSQYLTSECLKKIKDTLTKKYKYVGFCCRTKNIAMIKVGLNNGFNIIGMKLVLGLPNLEFLLEREN